MAPASGAWREGDPPGERRFSEALGIRRWACMLGPSLGGMRVLEWLVAHPERLVSAIVIGATAASRTSAIAALRNWRCVSAETLRPWKIPMHGTTGDLARRFDANSYIALTQAMSLFDLGRGQGGGDQALRAISQPLTVVGVDSDRLFPLD